MIAATEALNLPGAQLLNREREEVRDALAALDKLIREKMTYCGMPPLNVMLSREIPTLGIETAGFYLSSDAAAKALRVAMSERGWEVGIQLMSTPPRLQSGTPLPHHWVLQIAPKFSEYERVDTRAGAILQ